MHVGVFLEQDAILASAAGLPHARGGVSKNPWIDSSRWQSSPCTWGCFFHLLFCAEDLLVFPMHVGVFL